MILWNDNKCKVFGRPMMFCFIVVAFLFSHPAASDAFAPKSSIVYSKNQKHGIHIHIPSLDANPTNLFDNHHFYDSSSDLPSNHISGGHASTSEHRLPHYLMSSATPAKEKADIRGGESTVAKPASNKKQLYREMFAEMLGTFIIVGLGSMGDMSAIFTGSLVGLFQIASVWAIAVTVAICTTASISDAHLNPGISIAFAMFRPSEKFGWSKVVPYCLAQLAGASLGSLVAFRMYASTIAAFEAKQGIVRAAASGLASVKAFGCYFADPVTASTVILSEIIGTALLAFTVFSLTNSKNKTMKDGFVPPIIGLVVGSLVAGVAPLTQACFNPARDLGPRLVSFIAGWRTTSFMGWWIYMVAPVLGCIVGGFVADKMLYGGDDE